MRSHRRDDGVAFNSPTKLSLLSSKPNTIFDFVRDTSARQEQINLLLLSTYNYICNMILIVDDDPSIRLSIELMLRQGGFESATASNEEEAMAAVRHPGLELVILDMNLTRTTTGRQGIDMLRGIRILAPDVPVIMLSAWATVPLAVEGMGYGAVDFVQKPWSNRDFMAKIRTALKNAEAKRAAKAVDTLDNTERSTIIKALRQADGNIASAAALLGITRQSLYRRMEKFGIK